jgi:hypothetical protein
MSRFPLEQRESTRSVDNPFALMSSHRSVETKPVSDVLFHSGSKLFSPTSQSATKFESGQSRSADCASGNVGVGFGTKGPLEYTLAVSKTSIGTGELKVLPSYLRMRNSFVGRVHPIELFRKIYAALTNPGLGFTVDLHPSADKLKLRGQGICGVGRAVFTVNFYQNPVREVVVVCSRRAGCPLLFNRIFYRLIDSLGDAIVRRCDKPAPPAHEYIGKPPDVPRLRISALCEMISRLIERARSPVLDEQIGACEALLEFSQGDERALLLELNCTAELLGLVDFLLRAEDDEVVRIGAVTLKNLLELESVEFNQSVPAPLVQRMFELLDTPSTYLNRDAKRHLSAGLRCVSKTRQEIFTPHQLQMLRQTLQVVE